MGQDHFVTADALRKTFRGMAATTSIITTEYNSSRFGMVATAVMSLSLEPPVLVIGINRSASIHDPLISRGAFAINVLSMSDYEIARGCSSARGEERFAYGEWLALNTESAGLSDIPYLNSAQSNVFCRNLSVQSTGTHSLITAEVVHILAKEVIYPLVYCDGTYGKFDPLARMVA
jgi:flavin reductase